MATDFTFVDHGSIWLLTANTEPAQQWVEDHIPSEVTRWGAWPGQVVVEHRFVLPILDGIEGDGLNVEVSK